MAPRACLQRLKVEGEIRSPREAERVRIASIILKRESWTVNDFGKRLGLCNYGLDIAKDLGADVGIDNDAVVAFFGPRGDQDWKLERTSMLSQEDYIDCRRQYELVDGHPSLNGYFLATFLRAWLVEKKNHKVNWAKFEQIGRSRQVNQQTNVEQTGATPSLSKQSSFSDWMDGSPMESQENQDDNNLCFITGSQSATIFLPHQLPQTWGLLVEA